MYLYLLLSVAAIIAPAYAAVTTSGSASMVDALSIYSLQINPNPIFAGNNVTIDLQIYDSYSSTLNNVNLELEGSYPILNVSPSNPSLISSIGPGLYGGLNSYFTYTVHVPKNTPSGNYTLDLVAQYQTVETVSGLSTTITGTSIMPITFYVHGTPAMTINPSVSGIVPGSTSSVMLNVMNSGYGTARNITVSILNSSNFSATGTKRFSIGSLGAGAATSLSATYLVNSHIVNGTYTVPLYVTYYSDQGTEYSQLINESISVRIQNPNIVATIVAANPQTLYIGYNQSLTLSISNIGYGNANNVTVDVEPVSGLNLLSSIHHFFIGSLPAGQAVTETVLVTANNNTGQGAGLDAFLGYYSSNYQNHFSKAQSLNLSVAQSPIFQVNAGKYNLVPGDTTVPINLTITNTGNIEAQQVQLSFQSSYPLTPVTSSAYIPTLKPGQSTTVTFFVSVDSNGAVGTYPITVYETWRQPNGAVQQTYSSSSNYYALVSSSSSSSGSGSMLTDIIVVVVIVVVAVVAYRRMSKKAEGKKKTPKAL
jgi:hypothetical protein